MFGNSQNLYFSNFNALLFFCVLQIKMQTVFHNAELPLYIKHNA